MKKILTLSLACVLCISTYNATAATLDLKANKDSGSKVTISPSPKKPKKIKKNYGLSGQFLLSSDLKDLDSVVGASVKWKPKIKDYYYLKASFKQDLSVGEDKFSYGWNLGYDDYHEGTWSPQINHWGGIKPGQGLDTDNAVASLGYKIKSDFLKKYRLKSGVTVSKQLSGDSDFKLSTSLQWSPKQYWYIKAILVNNLKTGDAIWNYVAGYDDWHPKTWAFEYSNYNQNPLDEVNFKKGGQLAITYKWAF